MDTKYLEIIKAPVVTEKGTRLGQEAGKYLFKVDPKATKDDVKLAGIIGLLHDIGRFYQWKTFHTYNDVNTIDHGNKGVEILKIDNYIRKYLDDERQIDILFNAVLNHNKISINNITFFSVFFIILDIFFTYSIIMIKPKGRINSFQYLNISRIIFFH